MLRSATSHIGDTRDAAVKRIVDAAADHEGLALVRAVLRAAPGRIALTSSFGAESAVLLDMVASVDPATPILFLETGMLFEETLAYQEDLARLLGLTDVRHLRPDDHDLERYDEDGTLWQHDPDFCCHIRKSEPLDEALRAFDGWITGRKRFQGGARVDLRTVEVTTAGDPEGHPRVKINPLAHWSLEDMRHYRRLRQLPLHPLQPRGFTSIGCRPCTSPAGGKEQPRAGRWRGLDKNECGIHNL